jgi:inner membrane protein
MASFGHVAAGLLAGRLHGGGKRADDGQSPGDGSGPEPRRRPTPWWTMLLFSGLALLPDADVLLVALGACDSGFCGHRGASIARRVGWPAIRTGIAMAIAVGSHAALDLLGEGGRGLPLLWPFTDHRFESPIRLFPDAPRGWALLSRVGVVNLVTELVLFSPLVIYALWPRIVAWRSARSIARGIAKLPDLTFIEGGVAPAGGVAPSPAPIPAPAATDEGDPSVRSAG